MISRDKVLKYLYKTVEEQANMKKINSPKMDDYFKGVITGLEYAIMLLK